jgi:hypothetical protein|tara:strand:+ start:449 stop:1096 length:648 start_codon:yes stop_codon:yes gene_type:complete
MKLITEMNEDVEFIIERSGDGKKPGYFISGVFMQAEQKNRNGRIYPMEVLQPKVNDYIIEFVDKNRAFGELNHPQGPTVNLDRVSHLIKDLCTDGHNFTGKAKIMETPMGKIVQSLMDEGAKLGVSTRGMGSLKEVNGVNRVQSDFSLAAVDIVADPSAPDAFVDGIMEGKEWIWENGLLKEKHIQEYKKQITNVSSRNMKKKFTNLFEDFLRKI